MALENLEPATRIESILDGENIAPATRLEYFLKQAAAGGGGGSEIGDSVLFVKPTGTVYVMDTDDSTVYMAAADKPVSEINATASVKPVFVCFPDIEKFTNADNPTISFESTHVYPATDFKESCYRFAINGGDIKFVFDYNPPVSQLQNMYVIGMMRSK